MKTFENVIGLPNTQVIHRYYYFHSGANNNIFGKLSILWK